MNEVVVARRYRLGRRIGAGGMGRVWLAVDEVLQREVAIKEIVLPDGLTEDDAAELRMRTLREARTAAALSHPNVIQIYDVIYAQQRPWIVMEYIESRSLAQVIHEDGPLPPEYAAKIGLSVLAALVTAHESGVLHRDVKPGNVLLGFDDRVILTDFGLATFEDVGSALTASGVVHGSPQFIAPERALDGTSTAAADMWSLGATLYAAVEGRAPYARASSYATLTALATAPPDPPRNAGPLKPLLGGLLRRNPANRLKPDEIRSWLQQIAAAVPPRSHIIPRQRKRNDPAASSSPVGSPPVSSPPVSAPPVSAPPAPPTEGSKSPSVPPSASGQRNRRLYNDSFGARRRVADASKEAPEPPEFEMPVAGARPAARPVSSSQAAFVHPAIDDERDTDRQMDLAWQLDAAAGLLGAPAREQAGTQTRSHQRAELRRRRARRRRTLWIGGLTVLAVLAAAGTYVFEQHRKPSHTATVTPPVGTRGTAIVGPVVGVVWPCAPQAAATPATSVKTVPPPGPNDPPVINAQGQSEALPPNFAWYTFTNGLIGAVPIGWRVVSQVAGTTCFYDPNSRRVLGVRVLPTIGYNPTATFYQDEKALKASNTVTDYHELGIQPVPYTPGRADWIFTFATPQDPTTMQAQVRAVFSNTQVGFMICWITPEPDWTTEQPNYQAISSNYTFASR